MKKCVLFMMCCILLLSMVGCGSSKAVEYPTYDENATISNVASGVVASNAAYELIWDDTAYCVMLRDVQSGYIWSNIPYDYLQEGGSSANINSTVNITVIKQANLTKDSFRSYSDAVEDGNVSCEKVENGVRVTYYFEKAQISVPVIYTLGAKSMDVTLDVQNIGEGEDYKILSASLSPFFCSALNQNEDSYVMVPSGSGALIYTTENVEGARKYSAPVYGRDLSQAYFELAVEEEPLRLPVFGVKNGENGMLCVMKDGAESATVEVEAGNSRTGYTTVYPTYYIRGYDELRTTASNKATLGGGDFYSVSSLIRASVNPTLSYFPLEGEDADYNGMAKCYRQYLENSGGLVKTSLGTNYGLTIIGGAQVTDSVMGIPCDSTLAATTFTQAQTILTSLTESAAIQPTVRLVGFGDRGVNPGSLAGGFSFAKVFGTIAQRKALETYCADKGISLFSDFDLIRFNLSGNGFSTTSDVAQSASLRKVTNYPIGTPQREKKLDYAYKLLSRSQLIPASQKLLKAANKSNVSGVSLMTLGHAAYSDYADSAYAVKNNTQTEVSAVINSFIENGHAVAGGPNAYSAIASSVVFDVPTDNGGNFVFDQEIPFYELVFSGAKPIFGESINLADDMNAAILRTLAYGANMSFSVLYEYDTDFTETDMLYEGTGANKLYACSFSANEKLINSTLTKYGSLYEKLNNASMVRYTALSASVTETVFDNGVTLYINHSGSSVDSPVGELAAYEVRY